MQSQRLHPLNWLRTRYLAALFFGVVIAFLVGGRRYWDAGALWPPYHCLYADANCSLAFSTYILDFFTGMAFLAAYYAAKTALRTYGMEQSAILAERSCPNKEHQEQAHVVLTLTPEFDLREQEPDSEDREYRYIPFDYDFENLGRSPIVDAYVWLECSYDAVARMCVPLGSIRRDGHVHVRVYIWYGFVQAKVEWLKLGASRWELEKTLELDFRPSRSRRTGFLAAAPLLPGRPPAVPMRVVPGGPEDFVDLADADSQGSTA